MKYILIGSVAALTALTVSGCSPYSWQKQYGTSEVVNLDGPLRKNVTYVKGNTVFAGPASAEMMARSAVPQQQPIIQQPVVQPQVISQPVSVSSFAAPSQVIQSPTVSSTVVTSPVLNTTGGTATLLPTNPTPAVTVPPAFINAGQSANLQTRRVGDAGIVVFSDAIEMNVAVAAANRSCSNEGKAASTTPAIDVATGVKQMNFTCG